VPARPDLIAARRDLDTSADTRRGFSLPAQRPAFDIGPEAPADIS
jgi:hypothetical protein